MPTKYVKKNKCQNCYNFLKIKNRPNYLMLDKVNKHRYRLEIVTKLKQVAQYANTLGLNLENVCFTKKNALGFQGFTNKNVKILKSKPRESEPFRVMKCMDIAMLSYRKFDIFKKNYFFNFTTINRIRRERFYLNGIINSNHNDYGFFFEPDQKVKLVLTKIIKNLQPNKIINDEIILKLSLDGTNLTKIRHKVLNVCFTVINDEKNAMSVNGNCILGRSFLKINNDKLLVIEFKSV